VALSTSSSTTSTRGCSMRSRSAKRAAGHARRSVRAVSPRGELDGAPPEDCEYDGKNQPYHEKYPSNVRRNARNPGEPENGGDDRDHQKSHCPTDHRTSSRPLPALAVNQLCCTLQVA